MLRKKIFYECDLCVCLLKVSACSSCVPLNVIECIDLFLISSGGRLRRGARHAHSLPSCRTLVMMMKMKQLSSTDMDVLEASGSGWDCCGNRSDWEGWEDQSLFTYTELVVLTALCVPLLLLGLLGNALTILVVWRRPQMRSTTYLYLSSMALSDVLILLLMPLDLYKVCFILKSLLVSVSVGCQFCEIEIYASSES